MVSAIRNKQRSEIGGMAEDFFPDDEVFPRHPKASQLRPYASLFTIAYKDSGLRPATGHHKPFCIQAPEEIVGNLAADDREGE
jgi:hypothetical protein